MEFKVHLPQDSNLTWEISQFGGGFHASCMNEERQMPGSGFSLVRETAKKKALAELNERLLVMQLHRTSQKEDWGLDFDDSCSGFAVGYNKTKTELRALAEGLERWTLSHWIDQGFEMAEISIEPSNQLRKDVSTYFETISTYLKTVNVLMGNQLLRFNIAVILGWAESGVFAGYGTKLNRDEAIDHAHIEALRNLLIYRNQRQRDDFPYNRIWFFAQNATFARLELSRVRSKSWPIPILALLKTEYVNDLWLSRAIFEGWTPWQMGSENRFLY